MSDEFDYGFQKNIFMNEDQQIEMRLWNYIDGISDAEEKARIEVLLKTDVQWQQVYRQLLEMHQQMKDEMELEQPSMRFTKNVMDEISKAKVAPATKNYINNKFMAVLGFFFVLLIGGFVVYLFTQLNWRESNNSFELPLPNISKLNFSQYFNQQFVDIFVMLNAVLALILVDRILARKRNISKQRHG
jgi:hypothetical protein